MGAEEPADIKGLLLLQTDIPSDLQLLFSSPESQKQNGSKHPFFAQPHSALHWVPFLAKLYRRGGEGIRSPEDRFGKRSALFF